MYLVQGSKVIPVDLFHLAFSFFRLDLLPLIIPPYCPRALGQSTTYSKIHTLVWTNSMRGFIIELEFSGA